MPTLILDKNVDANLHPGFRPPSHLLWRTRVVPDLVSDDLIGVHNLGSRAEVKGYSEEDLQVLTRSAENAGITCRHAQPSGWTRQTTPLDPALQGHHGYSIRRAA